MYISVVTGSVRIALEVTGGHTITHISGSMLVVVQPISPIGQIKRWRLRHNAEVELLPVAEKLIKDILILVLRCDCVCRVARYSMRILKRSKVVAGPVGGNNPEAFSDSTDEMNRYRQPENDRDHQELPYLARGRNW